MIEPKKRRFTKLPRPETVSQPLTEDQDPTTTMTLRVRKSTAEAIADAAKAQGLTMKQVICKALTQAGVDVASVDLEDRTPRRHS